VSPTGPYARASGGYTGYGDVLSLLKQQDDRFAILGSGEEAALEFDPAGLPNVTNLAGPRDYFLYAGRLCQGHGFYSAYSSTVEPLPFHAMGQYPYPDKVRFPEDKAHLDYRFADEHRVNSTGNFVSIRLSIARLTVTDLYKK
jgi:hypothetical protein